MDKAREKYLRDIISRSGEMENALGGGLMSLVGGFVLLLLGSFITADGGSAGTFCSVIGICLVILGLAYLVRYTSLEGDGLSTNYQKDRENAQSELEVLIAQDKENRLDYESAIIDFKKMGMHDDAKRVRRKMLDEKKVDQTVVHGDYVDDRDTIIKDSVVSKSSIGGGSSKMQELEKLKEMFDSGFISKKEMEEMKKEILGK